LASFQSDALNPSAQAVVGGNEDEVTHVALNEATVNGKPGYGHLLTTGNSDADKGGIAEVKKASHWKQQYGGVDCPLPSTVRIEAHADLYGESIYLHPAFKRPKDRPKTMKRKAGYM
jgi:hypothetical protein